MDDYDSEEYDYGRVYYIREDVYDELAETLSTLTLDYFCYLTYTEEGWALMDDQTMASLKHDIYLGDEVYGPDYIDRLYENGYYFENSADVFRCTKDMMISEYFGQITEISSPKGNILYIETYLDSMGSMPVCIVLSHPELYRNVLQPYESVYEEFN